MIKAVLFDFDGVICNSFEIAYSVARITNDNLSRDEYRDFFNGNFYQEKKITKEVSRKFFELQNERFKDVVIDDDVKEVIRELKKDHELYIVSSNLEETIHWTFKNSSLSEGLFNEVLGYESGKSKIEKIQYILDKYNLKKEDCVFVTDTLGDILEATVVGIGSIGIDTGFHDRKRLEAGKPKKIVSSFRELLLTIKNL